MVIKLGRFSTESKSKPTTNHTRYRQHPDLRLSLFMLHFFHFVVMVHSPQELVVSGRSPHPVCWCQLLSLSSRVSGPWCQPIRGQYPGHVTTVDQSEAGLPPPRYWSAPATARTITTRHSHSGGYCQTASPEASASPLNIHVKNVSYLSLHSKMELQQ